MNVRKTFFIIFLIVLSGFSLRGQSTLFETHNKDISHAHAIFGDDYYYGERRLDNAFVSVVYRKTFVWDTLGFRRCSTEDILLVGQTWTKYQDIIKYQYDTGIKEDLRGTERKLLRAISYNTFWAGFYDVLLFNRPQNETVFTCRMGAEDYQVTEKAPSLNWALTDSTRRFGSYLCQQATTVFGGRLWYAWFTSEVPIPVGPWKLGGLPGLIVFAYDDSRQYEFEALSVSNEEVPINKISYPYRPITRKQYNRMIREMMEEYYTFVNSHLAGSGVVRIGEIGVKHPKETMRFSVIERNEE